MVEKFIKVLKEIGKIPDLKKAYLSKIDIDETDSPTYVHIQGLWSFKNYINDESNILNSSYIYDLQHNRVHSFPPAVVDKRVILSAESPCSSKSACLLQDDGCCYLNIFTNGEETTSLNLKDKDIHGKVYKDADLSSFCWSPDSKYLAFVAEKKRPKTSSYLSKKSETKNEGWGEKYEYIDDWGEQLTGQHTSVVVVVDTTSEEVKVLELPDDLCGGDVVWTPHGDLVGVAFVTNPYRLGLIYCRNRASCLFQLTLDGKFVELTSRELHVQSPRFSPDGSNLLFLRGPVGGPHIRCAQLCLLRWETRETIVLIDYVDKEQKISDEKSFYGMDGRAVLPLRCWSKDSQNIIFSTSNFFCMKSYVFNVDTKTVREIPSPKSLTLVHDIKEDYILASTSSLTEPTSLIIVPLDSGMPKDAITVSRLRSVEGIPPQWQDQWSFQNPVLHPVEEVSKMPIPVLYVGPTKLAVGESKRPLIVWPHGGPHSMIDNCFLGSVAVFVRLGYSVLFPNYRGSLGQGRLALESLPGQCGSMDVSDVYQATLDALNRFSSVLDESRVALNGGSHGGFLVTHLAAQHPDTYSVVSTRNPVIDISTMSSISDIYDWAFVESGFDYQMGKVADGTVLSKMHAVSPLALIDKVKAPTLLLLGKEDRRVPYSQGLLYHKMLLARKVPTKTYVYDDCHPLGKPDIEADCLIQALLWYQKHM